MSREAPSHAPDASHESSVATYVVVALVLGVITYVEFAIVEYDIAWLSPTWILIWLGLLSVVKFFLVIWVFMHLKDDEVTYSGFFSSGLVIALVSFVVLVLFLFSGRAFVEANLFAQENAKYTSEVLASYGEEDLGVGEVYDDADAPPDTAPGGAAAGAAGAVTDHAPAGGHGGGVPAEIQERIATDGYSREVGELIDNPRPRQGAVVLRPPLAEYPEYSVAAASFGLSAAQGADAEGAAQEGATDATGGATDEGATDEGATGTDATDGGPDGGGTAGAAADWDRELGEATYANCAACHQADGGGLAGVFPPLAGNMPELLQAEGGRDYLIHVMLYGLQGQITVDGTAYNGAMPAWAQFSDEQIAAVLDHELTAWGNDELLEDFVPITADEVAAARGRDLSPADVLEMRPELP